VSKVTSGGTRRPARLPRQIQATIRAYRADQTNWRLPLSGKQPPQQTTRKERRATGRQDRFEADRRARKTNPGSRKGGSGSALVNTRNMTIAAVVVGVLIVAFVAVGQLGNRVTGTFTDPGISYPASIQHNNVLGSDSAPVTLEVYGDFQCPVCAKNSLDVEPSIVTRYVIPGQVRIIQEDIAILGRPTPTDPANESRIAASGAQCADQQGKYWDYAHWVFGNQDGENAGGFSRDRIIAIAAAAGLDSAAFTSCIDTAAATDPVDQLTAKALSMGIDSTPTMYINGAKVTPTGYKTVDQMNALIDQALAASSASPAASGSGAPSVSASANP
jgi:protein-disulfide isomerase